MLPRIAIHELPATDHRLTVGACHTPIHIRGSRNRELALPLTNSPSVPTSLLGPNPGSLTETLDITTTCRFLRYRIVPNTPIADTPRFVYGREDDCE